MSDTELSLIQRDLASRGLRQRSHLIAQNDVAKDTKYRFRFWLHSMMSHSVFFTGIVRQEGSDTTWEVTAILPSPHRHSRAAAQLIRKKLKSADCEISFNKIDLFGEGRDRLIDCIEATKGCMERPPIRQQARHFPDFTLLRVGVNQDVQSAVLEHLQRVLAPYRIVICTETRTVEFDTNNFDGWLYDDHLFKAHYKENRVPERLRLPNFTTTEPPPRLSPAYWKRFHDIYPKACGLTALTKIAYSDNRRRLFFTVTNLVDQGWENESNRYASTLSFDIDITGYRIGAFWKLRISQLDSYFWHDALSRKLKATRDIDMQVYERA